VVFGDFMMLGHQSSLSVRLEHRRKRKRRSSLYFSSSRALRRSRVKRSKKVMSKSGKVGLGEVRKPIRFEGASSDSVGVGGHHLVAVEEDAQALSVDYQVGGAENVTSVSSAFSIFNSLKLVKDVHHFLT